MYLFTYFTIHSSISFIRILLFINVFTMHFALCPMYYFTMHYALYTTHYSLFTINYLLFTIHYLPFTIYHLPFTIQYLLFTINYLYLGKNPYLMEFDKTPIFW